MYILLSGAVGIGVCILLTETVGGAARYAACSRCFAKPIVTVGVYNNNSAKPSSFPPYLGLYWDRLCTAGFALPYCFCKASLSSKASTSLPSNPSAL